MVGAHKMHCGQCPKPIESGQYRLIHSAAKRICIRSLDGQTVKIIDNDDYDERFGKLTEGIRGVIDKTNELGDKCPCPDGHLGRHKFSCPELRKQLTAEKKNIKWDQLTIKPKHYYKEPHLYDTYENTYCEKCNQEHYNQR